MVIILVIPSFNNKYIIYPIRRQVTGEFIDDSSLRGHDTTFARSHSDLHVPSGGAGVDVWLRKTTNFQRFLLGNFFED